MLSWLASTLYDRIGEPPVLAPSIIGRINFTDVKLEPLESRIGPSVGVCGVATSEISPSEWSLYSDQPISFRALALTTRGSPCTNPNSVPMSARLISQYLFVKISG